MFVIDNLKNAEKWIKKTKLIIYFPGITTVGILMYFFLAFLLAFILQIFTEPFVSVGPSNSCWEYCGIHERT